MDAPWRLGDSLRALGPVLKVLGGLLGQFYKRLGGRLSALLRVLGARGAVLEASWPLLRVHLPTS